MAYLPDMIVVRLSPKHAKHVWLAIDGALGAGAGDMPDDECEALREASAQLVKQLTRAGTIGKKQP